MDNFGNEDCWNDANEYSNQPLQINGDFGHLNFDKYSRKTFDEMHFDAPLVTNGYNLEQIKPNFKFSSYQNTTSGINESINNRVTTNFVHDYGNAPSCNTRINYEDNGFHQRLCYNAYPSNDHLQNFSLQDIHFPSNNGIQQPFVPQPFNDLPAQPIVSSSCRATSDEPQNQSIQYTPENDKLPSLPSLDTSDEKLDNSEDSDDSSGIRATQSKKRGRPPVHKTETARKAAKNAAQKNYDSKIKAALFDLRIEVPMLKRDTTELKTEKETLLKTCISMFSQSDLPEIDRNLIGGELNMFQSNI